MRLRRRCGRRYKKMMTNMGLAGCSLLKWQAGLTCLLSVLGAIRG